MPSALDLVLPSAITDTTMIRPGLSDPLLDTAPAGAIRFLFDLAANTSWAKQAAPVAGDPVVDLAAVGDGSMQVNGTAPTFAGGGIDFTGISASGNDVIAPACLGSIYGAAHDYFMVCEYVKLPAQADWSTSGSIQPFFCTTSVTGGYTAEADLLTIGATSLPSILGRRQLNGGSTVDAVQLSAGNLTPHFGKIVQLAFWRNSTTQAMRLRSSGGTHLVSGAINADNTGDYSTKQPRFGVSTSFSAVGVWNKWKLYRGWIDDLTLDTRDPATTLDADYKSVITDFASAPRFS